MRNASAIAAGGVLVVVAAAALAVFLSDVNGQTGPEAKGMLDLPEPKHDGEVSVEKALLGRRSVRRCGDKPLALAEVSQLLWAAQGVTDPKRGFRTAPSAGALYPLETYIVAGNVNGLADGVYRYLPRDHTLLKVADGDRRAELARAALGQPFVGRAPAVIVFSAVYERVTRKYGERGVRYVDMEAGHAAQNVYLQCESLGLGTVVVGAFRDKDVKRLVGLGDDERPLYLLPVGRE